MSKIKKYYIVLIMFIMFILLVFFINSAIEAYYSSFPNDFAFKKSVAGIYGKMRDNGTKWLNSDIPDNLKNWGIEGNYGRDTASMIFAKGRIMFWA